MQTWNSKPKLKNPPKPWRPETRIKHVSLLYAISNRFSQGCSCVQTLWVQEDGLENRTACTMTSSKGSTRKSLWLQKGKLPVVLFQRTLRAVNQSPQSHKGDSRGNPGRIQETSPLNPKGGFQLDSSTPHSSNPRGSLHSSDGANRVRWVLSVCVSGGESRNPIPQGGRFPTFSRNSTFASGRPKFTPVLLRYLNRE